MSEPVVETVHAHPSRRNRFVGLTNRYSFTPRKVIAWALALTTAGSGLLNLFSVIGRRLPGRQHVLRDLFPLEFLHLTRFGTLLIGLALIVSSFNILKRKRRAFFAVCGLSALSIVLHLVKGFDYEEAALSALVLGVLVASRRQFTVMSRRLDAKAGIRRLAAVAAAAVVYGIAGFWWLEPHEFGRNFTLSAACRQTFSVLFGFDALPLTPHTHYAAWFVGSLHLLTATLAAYGLWALFRPVVYHWRVQPREQALAERIVAAHGRSALDYFKFGDDKSFYFSPSGRSFLAYRVSGSFALVLADPVGPEDEIESVIRDFADHCADNDWRVAFHQTLPDFLPVYRRLGFRKLKLGDDAVVDLTTFSLDGKSRKKLRHVVNLLEKSGFRVRCFKAPLADDMLAELRSVSDEWLQLPGRRERRFTLGVFDPDYLRNTPVVAVVDANGRIPAFANIIPSYRRGEATVDLMRHRLNVPNGIMDFLFIKLFMIVRDEGYSRFNLGMAPMGGFREREEATIEERTVHSFFQNLNLMFSFTGIKRFKAKYATAWEPRYVVYRTVLDLPRVALALRDIAEVAEK